MSIRQRFDELFKGKYPRKQSASKNNTMSVFIFILIIIIYGGSIWVSVNMAEQYDDSMSSIDGQVFYAIGELGYDNVTYDVRISFIATDGVFFVGDYIKTNVMINARDGNESLNLSGITFTIFCNNAGIGEDGAGSVIPEAANVSKYGNYDWKETYFFNFRSAGNPIFKIALEHDGHGKALTIISDAITVDSRSTKYQMEGMMFQISANCLIVGLSVATMMTAFVALLYGRWLKG